MENEITIADLFEKQYPEIAKKLKDENCWDFKIISPLSFEDSAEIVVRIQWKQNKTWHRYKIKLGV